MRSSKSRSRSKANRPRTLGNIINRVFDSSGPEGKVRGTPQQIIEKYLFLARDAQLSNDRVAAENFLQHAEHYTRLLGEAQREMAADQENRRFDGGNGQPRQDGNGWANPQGGYGGNNQPRDFRDDPRDEQPRRDDQRDNRDQPRQDNRRDDRRPEQQRQDQPRQDRDQPRQDRDQPRQDRDQPRQENRDRRPDFRNDRRDGNRPDQPRREPVAAQGPAAVIDLDGDDDTGLVETPEAKAPVQSAVLPVAASAPESSADIATVPADEPVSESAAPKPARKPRAPRKPKETPAAVGDDPKEAAE